MVVFAWLFQKVHLNGREFEMFAQNDVGSLVDGLPE